MRRIQPSASMPKITSRLVFPKLIPIARIFRPFSVPSADMFAFRGKMSSPDDNEDAEPASKKPKTTQADGAGTTSDAEGSSGTANNHCLKGSFRPSTENNGPKSAVYSWLIVSQVLHVFLTPSYSACSSAE